MRKLFFALLMLLSVFSFGKDKAKVGIGPDLSPNAAFLSFRDWINKTNGFEIGFGPSAKLEDFIFNDMSIQGKYLAAFKSNRNYYRTYVGAIARYTVIKDPHFHKNMLSGGILLGNEWYWGKFRNQGFAIEGGALLGRISRKQYVEGTNVSITRYYKEFPLYVAFSYKYYFR